MVSVVPRKRLSRSIEVALHVRRCKTFYQSLWLLRCFFIEQTEIFHWPLSLSRNRARNKLVRSSGEDVPLAFVNRDELPCFAFMIDSCWKTARRRLYCSIFNAPPANSSLSRARLSSAVSKGMNFRSDERKIIQRRVTTELTFPSESRRLPL